MSSRDVETCDWFIGTNRSHDRDPTQICAYGSQVPMPYDMPTSSTYNSEGLSSPSRPHIGLVDGFIVDGVTIGHPVVSLLVTNSHGPNSHVYFFQVIWTYCGWANHVLRVLVNWVWEWTGLEHSNSSPEDDLPSLIPVDSSDSEDEVSK